MPKKLDRNIDEQKQQSKGTRKTRTLRGRSRKAYWEKYKMLGLQRAHKARRMARHLKRHPSDKQTETLLKCC
jgi:hypothetical protein